MEKVKPTRLAKYLAAAGIASRRAAEKIIEAGRVTVNGKIALVPQTMVSGADQVIVDGKVVGGSENTVYYLLNKPAGYISAVRDTHQRPVVTDLLKSVKTRVYPVGRLDFDTSGVLLLTNDGELAYRLTHPRYGVQKIYRAWVRGVPGPDILKKMSAGMEIDQVKTAPAKVRLIKTELNKKQALLELTLTEGRKRQVKLMCAAAGYPVIELERKSFAGLETGTLAIGSFRRLRDQEIKALYRLVGLDKAE